MSNAMPFRIHGIGRYVPPRVVSSAEIEEKLGLEKDWIVSKTGIKERRWVTDDTAITMAAKAARAAVADAGLELSDIDCIIYGSGTPAQAIPDGGHLLQRELGLGSSGRPACLAVHATCMSFLVALDTAAGYVARGRHKRILCVSSDVASRGFNPDDPKSMSLFGDAAAAAVVGPPDEGQDSAILETIFESYGDDADLARIPGWGTTRPPNDEATTKVDNVFFMDGPGVFLAARERMLPFLERFREALPDPNELPLFVPHQPSILALRGFRRAGVPEEKLVITLEKFGNCVAVSIPLTLHEAVTSGRLKRGDVFIMLGIGAGMCLGGMLLRY